MDLPVFLLVLLAAIAHAAWNGWLKNSSPNLVGLAAISTGWLLVGGVGVAFVGLPAASSWPYLLLTTVVHTVYAALLVSAYRHGEFSLTYPLARGTGPLIVAIAAPYVLHDRIDLIDLFAISLMVGGILLIGGAGSGTIPHKRHAILLSLATGIAIGTYTLIDAAGARTGSSPHTYAAWLFVLTAVALLAVTVAVHRKSTLALLTPHLYQGVSVGILSAVAYSIVLWAMTVAPAALVAAVRETSILFAALIGWGLLGERISALRWVGVMVAVTGLVHAQL